MKLTINDNDQLLDESGKVLGPVFDTLRNRPDISISDVQRAYDTRIKGFRDTIAALRADCDSLASFVPARKEAQLAAAQEVKARAEAVITELTK